MPHKLRITSMTIGGIYINRLTCLCAELQTLGELQTKKKVQVFEKTNFKGSTLQKLNLKRSYL
jgi:hypothetical protein